MNKQLTLIVFMVFHASLVMAASGIFQTYIILNQDGSGDSYYAGGINSDVATSYDGLSFSPNSTLILSGGEIKTFQNSGSNVTGAELIYRIYLEGSSPPPFQIITLATVTDLGGGDQRWETTSANIDLKQAINNTGAGSGNYTLEVFWRATSTDGDHFDSDFGNNFKATIVASSSFLPVELISFLAKNKQKHSLLSWQTATEINNSHFEIQRSSSTKSWLNIGQVAGKGTTNQLQSYTFEDSKPLSGKNYYRLKQLDFDGSYSYSPIVSLVHKEQEVRIYPNPVSHFFEVTLVDFEQTDRYTLFLANSLGQLIKQTIAETSSIQVDMSDLPTGLYTLSVINERGEVLFVEQLSKL